jgi:hypothetical protein
MVTAGVRDANRDTTEVEDAACGYSALPVTARFQGAHEGAYQRGKVRSGGRYGESRAAWGLEDLAGAR